MKKERGNALLGIVVIIIVLLVGGIFYWNNYQIQAKKNEEIRKQTQIAQTQIINQPEVITSTTTATSTTDNTVISFKLTDKDNGRTIAAKKSDGFYVTLSNPGDGGYLFDNPEYDTSLLHLVNHIHNPSISNTPGDFGSDVWEFVTLKAGITDLTINASRPWKKDDSVNIFKVSLAIK